MKPIINTTEELENFLLHLKDTKVIFLDTEFKRIDTYYPILCLIQISIGNRIALVDPTVKTCSIIPLLKILSDNNILKVFHSARQDLEIFYYYNNYQPIKPIFDTQIAASFCGFGGSVSYENLVLNIAGTQLDKSQRVTNWEKRPLSDKQYLYAVNDVLYLPKVYAHLDLLLTQAGRRAFHDEEAYELENPENFIYSAGKLWKRINFNSKNVQKIANLLAIIDWRENVAAQTNLNRARILSDQDLGIIVFGSSNSHVLHNLDEITLQQINEILNSSQNKYQKKAEEVLHQKFHHNNISKSSHNIMKIILKIRAKEQGIPMEIITNTSELMKLSQFPPSSIYLKQLKLMQGWRYEAFGKYAYKFLLGELALRIEAGEFLLF